MSNDIFVVFCSDGCLQYADMKMCQKEQWVPITVLRQGDEVIVPCFHDMEIAKKFAKRNYPKGWLTGQIALTAAEVEWIASKGWKLEVLTHPRLFKNLSGFGHEVLEIQSRPDLYMPRSKVKS